MSTKTKVMKYLEEKDNGFESTYPEFHRAVTLFDIFKSRNILNVYFQVQYDFDIISSWYRVYIVPIKEVNSSLIFCSRQIYGIDIQDQRGTPAYKGYVYVGPYYDDKIEKRDIEDFIIKNVIESRARLDANAPDKSLNHARRCDRRFKEVDTGFKIIPIS
jgi:hypothetical protein